MSRTSFVVLLFLVLTIFRLGYFGAIDTFTICSLVFGFYFIMLDWLIKNGRQKGFRYFEALITLLFVFNLFDFVDANTNLINIISYEIPAFKEGTLGKLGHSSQFIWSDSMSHGVVIRSIGVAGTNYASSALNAATCVYFFVVKKRLLFFLTFTLLIFWGVGSSLAAAILGIFLTRVRSNWIFLYFPIVIFLVVLLFKSRGFDVDHLMNITNNFGAFDLLAATIVGEGKAISSMQSEWRVIGLFFSLGALGSLFLAIMIYNYFIYSKYEKSCGDDHQFRGGLFFLLVLLISTIHYNTLLVFPNVFFLVGLISLSTAGFVEIRARTRIGTKASASDYSVHH